MSRFGQLGDELDVVRDHVLSIVRDSPSHGARVQTVIGDRLTILYRLEDGAPMRYLSMRSNNPALLAFLPDTEEVIRTADGWRARYHPEDKFLFLDDLTSLLQALRVATPESPITIQWEGSGEWVWPGFRVPGSGGGDGIPRSPTRSYRARRFLDTP